MLEVAQWCCQMCGIAFGDHLHRLPADDPALRRPDMTRARYELGWQPTTTMQEGLARTIEWFSGRIGP